MSLFNRNLYFVKRVVFNSNVNREKFRRNKQNFQKHRKFHTFLNGPQGEGPDNLLHIFMFLAAAYFVSKKI